MKILIVDDELVLREKLEKIVLNSGLPFQEVYTAKDAFEAIDIMNEGVPDIVMTDIRMPQKSGLELAQYIHEYTPEVMVIIITGYSEFEYAKAAIANNVFEYLLKPIDRDQTIACLKKCVRLLKSRNKERNMYHIFKKYFSDNYDTVKKQFFENLFFNMVESSPEALKHQLAAFQITLTAYRAVNIKCISSQGSSFVEEAYYFSHILEKYFNEQLEQAIVYCFGTITHLLWPVRSPDENQDADELVKLLTDATRNMEDNYPVRLICGISQISTTLADIKSLRQQASFCLEVMDKEAEQGIVFYEALSETKDSFSEQITQLIGYIKIRNYNLAVSCVEKIFKEKDVKIDYFYDIINLILLNVSIFLHEVQMDTEQIKEVCGRMSKNIQNKKESAVLLEELKKWIQELCDILQEFMQNKQNFMINTIYDYINKNYGNQIGLSDVASHVGRNSSYISRIIKQEVGETFTHILTQKRINEAKRLLKHTNLKVIEIAENCGFPNIRYFNRVFVEKVGMTANNYRKVVRTFSEE
ncbi:response regulator [Paenibacillus lutimineralis]|uniref:Response regulator n=1 Tax=Paenibacillus lutimineralis TaxID=2707005 RepID=A0A3S9USC4_9BACL|nr:response regulator [Paenibacillus lutimineralis]AZS13225.1 response regulator [Paenibacillus lutimineralis]